MTAVHLLDLQFSLGWHHIGRTTIWPLKLVVTDKRTLEMQKWSKNDFRLCLVFTK